MLLREDIPPTWQPTAQAALDWYNAEQGSEYELSGLADANLADTPNGQFPLGLVLCSGDVCARKEVAVDLTGTTPRFSHIDAPAAEIPPLLDPPAGVRAGWIDEQLEKYDFLLLLFYRGRW